jgi:hypothetical protein
MEKMDGEKMWFNFWEVEDTYKRMSEIFDKKASAINIDKFESLFNSLSQADQKIIKNVLAYQKLQTESDVFAFCMGKIQKILVDACRESKKNFYGLLDKRTVRPLKKRVAARLTLPKIDKARKSKESKQIEKMNLQINKLVPATGKSKPIE